MPRKEEEIVVFILSQEQNDVFSLYDSTVAKGS